MACGLLVPLSRENTTGQQHVTSVETKCICKT